MTPERLAQIRGFLSPAYRCWVTPQQIERAAQELLTYVDHLRECDPEILDVRLRGVDQERMELLAEVDRLRTLVDALVTGTGFDKLPAPNAEGESG